MLLEFFSINDSVKSPSAVEHGLFVLIQISVRMSCDASARRILRASERFRSNKGASKARRDQINGEIRNMRSLLPISAEDQERLSYLHSMSLICTFIRKSVLLSGVHEESGGVSPLYDSFLQALPGFIVALTRDGKLVYVSENVSEYLGLSMVDVLQGDSFYDMMDSRDAEAVRVMLREQDISAGLSFVCRMRSSKALRLQSGSCSVLVRGRFQSASLFVALCSPTADRLKDSQLLRASACFRTLHRPDMRLSHAPRSVLFHLGFSAEELIGRSWYDLLHPEDLALAADFHRTLIGEDSDANAEMLVRLQSQDRSWIWLYVCATVDRSREVITCTNHVISEAEAVYLKDKLYGAAQTSQMVCSAPVSQCHSKESEPLWSSETISTEQQLFFCTPPYSPTSSRSSSDFLSEGYGVIEQLAEGFCPSEAFSEPSAPPVCVPDAQLDFCESDCAPLSEDFSVFPLLTPEPSPTAEGPFLYSEAEMGTLALQIHSLASSFDAYRRPSQPQSGPCWPEPLLDESLIDCILRDLNKEPDWSRSRAFSAELHPCVYGHQTPL